jgi:hypothetical protein
MKVRAQGVKIACEAEKRMFRAVEIATTSAHLLVQRTIRGRAPSKII